MGRFEALTSTKHNRCSSLVETTIKSRSGRCRREGVFSPSMAIWTTFVPSSSTTSFLGYCRVPMIKRSGSGIGKIDHSVSLPSRNEALKLTFLSLHNDWTQPLYHVCPVPPEGRSHCFSLIRPVCSGLGHLGATEETLCTDLDDI